MVMRGVLVGVAIGAEELGEIAAQVLDGFARSLRTLGGLGEDERALEDGQIGRASCRERV